MSQDLTMTTGTARLARGLSTTSALTRFMRRQLFGVLKHLQGAHLCITEDFEGGAEHRFGPETAGLRAALTVHDPAAYVQIALGGDIGAGESYMDGLWSSDDLEAVVRAFLCDETLLDNMEGRLSWLTRPAYRWLHRGRRNDKDQARRNISAHYDLGNDFYSQWLDSRMLYSCAIYPQADSDLEAAQVEKIDRICRKLNIQPGQTVIEIGTGWGAMAMHAAEHYGAQVTTTTISREQAAYAREQVSARGLEDQVTILEDDYRDLTGQFDHLISVEMIEAVGYDYFQTYFKQIGALLKPTGKALIQAITIGDQRFDSYRKSTDFINQYIFPGGCLPSVEVINQGISANTALRLDHLEDIGLHYARTLRDWHTLIHKNEAALPESNRDPRFLRMWDYYLLSCAGAFAERRISTVQMLFAGPAADRDAIG